MATRRGRNEGSIFQAGDGRWVARIELGFGPDGKRRRKEIRGYAKTEVRDRLKELQRSKDDGLPTPDERVTLKAFLEHWLENTIRGNRRASTYRFYEYALRVHIIPELGRIRLTQLTPEHIDTFLSHKHQLGRARLTGDNEGLSEQTVQHLRAVLRSALGSAMKRNQLRRNVASLADGPRVPYHETRAISPDDARAIIEAVKGDRLESLFVTAVASGARQGELLALRWQGDVDLTAGTVSVNGTLQRSEGRFSRVEPKTRRSRRTVALPAFAVDALRAHKDRQQFERAQAGPLWQDSGLVFTQVTGAPLHSSTVNHQLQAILSKAQLPKITFHQLRHACASLLVALGVHPRVVMETLGHSQISTTMNLYSHVVPSLQREAARGLDALLTGSRES